jgi:cysteine-rich repeat protein
MKYLIFGSVLFAACTSSTTPPPGPVCGNGVVETGEACDDGNANGTTGDSCSASCTVLGTPQGHVSATWHLDSVDATTGALTQAGCPVGFDTAALHTVAANSSGTAVDACTSANSNCYIDLFNCTDFAGVSSALPAQNYLTWVEITSHDGSSVYATSTAEFVDITTVDMNFDTHILVDGGYFKLTWSLVGESSGNTLTCAQTAAAKSAGWSVEVVSTLSGTSTAFTDKFDCEDHFGYSAPLHSGVYDLVIDALNSSNQALGTQSTDIGSQTIGSMANDIVDLGHVMINVAGM